MLGGAAPQHRSLARWLHVVDASSGRLPAIDGSIASEAGLIHTGRNCQHRLRRLEMLPLSHGPRWIQLSSNAPLHDIADPFHIRAPGPCTRRLYERLPIAPSRPPSDACALSLPVSRSRSRSLPCHDHAPTTMLSTSTPVLFSKPWSRAKHPKVIWTWW